VEFGGKRLIRARVRGLRVAVHARVRLGQKRVRAIVNVDQAVVLIFAVEAPLRRFVGSLEPMQADQIRQSEGLIREARGVLGALVLSLDRDHGALGVRIPALVLGRAERINA
jgi:hypothetical protein